MNSRRNRRSIAPGTRILVPAALLVLLLIPIRSRWCCTVVGVTGATFFGGGSSTPRQRQRQQQQQQQQQQRGQYNKNIGVVVYDAERRILRSWHHTGGPQQQPHHHHHHHSHHQQQTTTSATTTTTRTVTTTSTTTSTQLYHGVNNNDNNDDDDDDDDGIINKEAAAASTSAHRMSMTTTTTTIIPTTTTTTNVVVQILMSDTGGGHRASANALRDAFFVLQQQQQPAEPEPLPLLSLSSSPTTSSSLSTRQQQPPQQPQRQQRLNITCDIVDLYSDYGTVWPYREYPQLYKLLATYPWSWAILYWWSATEIGQAINEWLLQWFCYHSFRQCINQIQPITGRRADMVISVHPLTNGLPCDIVRELDLGKDDHDNELSAATTSTTGQPSSSSTKTPMTTTRTKTPFCTVVTDLGSAHPTWFYPGVDKCFVPSTVLRQVALDRGLRDDQIVQHGLPIRSGFWSTTTTASSSSPSTSSSQTTTTGRNNKLNLLPNIPNVLVVGGGDGMGGLVDIARALGTALATADDDPFRQQHVQCQLTIVCGKNTAAKHILEQDMVKWTSSSSSLVPTQILGFVDNMDEWMQASTILVTKAGPGTIAEASICGLPCMMFSFLPGQEEGNIPFVEESGFGKYSNDPRVIAETIKAWLADPVLLEQMQQCALQAARPRATLDIANDLVELLLLQQQTKKEEEVKEEGEKLLGSSNSSSNNTDVGTNQAKVLLVK